MSATYKYVSVKLTQKCAASLWVLSLSKNEWGGQLFPAIREDGQCVLTCDEELIQGTGLEENEDEKFYLGTDSKRSGQVMIAVTPFYREVFQVHPLCTSDDSVNLFFHTHPLFLMPEYGMFNPPSLGDFFAHSLLSNFRNFKENNQLNTAIIASFEGIYVYFALPHRFMQFKERVQEVWRTLPNKTAEERKDYRIGELPERLIDVIKMETFDLLRQGFEDFMTGYSKLTKLAELSIVGAPILRDSKWNCKGCVPSSLELQFPFYKFIQTQTARAYVRNNPYLDALHANGFHYEFFPAPFTHDVEFLALVKAQFHDTAFKPIAVNNVTLPRRPESP